MGKSVGITPNPSGFGASIVLESASLRSGNEVGQILDALHTYGVLYAYDQHLTDEELIGLASALAPIYVHPFHKLLGECPYSIVRLHASARKRQVAADWHTDVSFAASPPSYGLMYGKTIPTCDSETSFIDMRAICRALPESMFNELISSGASHFLGTQGKIKREQLGDALYEYLCEQLPPVIHPAIRLYPPLAEPSLYVDLAHCNSIVNSEGAEKARLLKRVQSLIDASDQVFTFRWRPGAIVIWDQRCTLHRGSDKFLGEERLLLRIQMGSDAPASFADMI